MAKKKSAPTAEKKLPQFLYGYTRRNGQHVIPPRFEMAYDFDGPYARAKDGTWGVIDTAGTWVLRTDYDLLGPVEHGLVPVRQNGKWGVVDLSGKTVLPIEYDLIVSIGEKAISVKVGTTFAIRDRGNKVIVDDLEYLGRWSQGYAPAAQNGLGGYISEKGAWLVKPQYSGVYEFSEGLAAFEQDGKAGFIDLKGKVAIAPTFEAVFDFSEGLARFRSEYDYGYLAKDGTVAIPAEFGNPTKVTPLPDALYPEHTEAMTRFSNGYALAAKPTDTGFAGLAVGFIDKKGTWFDRDPRADSASDPAILVKRLENPEWTAIQETLELVPKFHKMLQGYEEKFLAALEKDGAQATKVIEEIISHAYDKQVAWLRLTVYDMNDYGLTVIPVSKTGEELSFAKEVAFYEKERIAFKTLAKFADKGGMSEPKTRKGLQLVNEVMEKMAMRKLEWFSDLWKKHAGSFALPVYIENEDQQILVELGTGKQWSEDDIIAGVKKKK